MNSEDDEPFSYITSSSHVSTSQKSLLRMLSSTRILMESPPDSHHAVSAEETPVVIEWGGEGSGGEAGEFKVVWRKADKKSLEVVDLGGEKVLYLTPMRERESEKGLDEDTGTKIMNLDEDEMCRYGEVERGPDENVSTKVVELEKGGRKAKMRERESSSVEAVDLDEDRDLHVRKGRSKKGFEKDTGMRNREVKMKERGDTSLEAIDLEDDIDLVVEKGELKRGLDGDMGTQVMDLDVNEMCRNREAERGPDGNVSTEVVDLDENRTCGDLGMRNGEMEMDREENTRADVDCDEDELYDYLTKKNLVGEIGTSKGGEVRRDEFRGFAEKGIEEIDHSKCLVPKDEENRQKDIGNSGWRELYDDLSQREKVIEKAVNKASEPCRDENRGSTEKGIEEIDRFICVGLEIDKFHQKGICDDLPRRNPNAKTVFKAGNEPCRDGIRRFAEKETDLPRGDDIRQKDKSLAEVCKLPSSLRMLAEIAYSESDVSHRERNGEENRHESNKSKCVGGKSRDSDELRDQTKNDKIMKNILNALELITGGEKEKENDGSDEEVDLLETAMIMGMVFPRPRWWPEERFDDD